MYFTFSAFEIIENGDGDGPLDTGTVLVQEIPFPTTPELSQMSPVLSVGEMPHSPLASPNLVMSNHPATALSLVQQQQLQQATSPGSVIDPTLARDGPQCFRIEEKKVASSSSSSYRSGNYSTEQATANAAETKRVQAGDVKYEEKASSQAHRQRIEVDGVTAEKSAALKQEHRWVIIKN